MSLEIGTIVEGTVKSITNFGAFVALEDGKTGMVHISEVANAYVSDIHTFLQEGQTVRVKILSISDTGKIALSVKKAETPAPSPQRTRTNWNNTERTSAQRESAPMDFEAKLKRFMADSDSKLSESRQYSEHRTKNRRGK